MKLVTRAFHDWCMVHGIPLDRVTLVVQSKDARTNLLVRAVVGREFAPDLIFMKPSYSSPIDGPAEINGVHVGFSVFKDGSR